MHPCKRSIIDEPIVSIIIPAYNVERYIEKCVKSAIKQSYKWTEIIVIDDGSTDRTGGLLDSIAMSYPFIRVVHKKNAGVSAARNNGIEMASGEYLVFIDGDDWIGPNFVDYMLSIVKNTDAEFGFSKNCFTKKGEKQIANDNIECLTPEEGTALLLSPRVIVGCWNKIYKKSLLVNHKIRFSEELFYGEGLNFITAVAQRANCIGVGNMRVYYYRRNNSFSVTTKFSIDSIHNGEKALDIITNNLIVKGELVNEMLLLHRCMYNIGAIVRVLNAGKKDEYYSDYCRWMGFNRSNISKIVQGKKISKYRKLLLIGGCIAPKIMAILDLIRRKIIASKSV